MVLQNFWNQNHHLKHINRGGYYQQQQHQVAGKYNQYDDNSSVGGLSGRQVYSTNTLPPLPRGPALAPLENSNRSGYSYSIDQDQCSTHSSLSQQA